MADNTYTDKILEAVAESEQQAQPTTTSDEITLSSGVVLRRKKFSPLRLQDIVSRFKYPDIPEVWDEERKRWFKNPDSPAYIDLKNQIDQERGMAALDAMVAFGTELVSIPEGVEAIDSDGWVEDNKIFGLEFNAKSKAARYLAWVKHVAVVDQEDFENIAQNYASSMGISEKEVSDKVNSFRN